MKRVLVVSAVRLLAESLATALKERGFLASFEVAGSARYLSRSELWDSHVALLHSDLLEDGVYARLIEELQAASVVIVGMSTTIDAGTLQTCLTGGASTVLSMESPLDHFVEAVHHVLTDRSLVEMETREQLAELREEESRAPVARITPLDLLTPREAEVLGEIMRGRSAQGIANESWVAMSTVRSQIKSILQKLGVNSQVAAVARAREMGWSPDKCNRGPRISQTGDRRSRARAVLETPAEEVSQYVKELA